MAAKKLKGAVGYGISRRKDHCGICRHYDDGRCAKVEGSINPDYWCRLFKPAATTAAAENRRS